jgi:ABC-type antimicrobial peptide transport system permease subunit
MALGASAFDVQSRIVSRTLMLAGAGLAGGVIAAFLLVRSMTGLLYGINTGDPTTFALSAFTMVVIAALAGYLPARRASRIDPMICLRAE